MTETPNTPQDRKRCCPACGKELPAGFPASASETACPHCGHAMWFPELPGLEAFDFLVKDAVLRDMKVDSRDDALGQLVRSLARAGLVPEESVPDVVDSLIRREQLGSTAIGAGYAIPHVKHPSIPDLIGNVGYVPKGVDFYGLDGVPVKIIFLLISPPNQPGDHLRALERISRVLRQAGPA